jgi:hypothetical protein
MDKNKKDDIVRLSASRIKTLGECSYYYYCRYHLKLPDKSNSGAKRGSVCHDLFELLTKSKWIGYAKEIYDSGCDLNNFDLVKRFIRAKCRKYELELLEADKKTGKTNIDMIYDMVCVGLSSGFFPEENEEIIDSEYAFDISDDELRFRIVGFIDKIVFDKKTKTIRISDYKSSKEKFKGEDLETNLQAMMYVLAANYLKNAKAIPDFKSAKAKFIFLRFPKNPYQELEFTEEQLDGFKHYLSYISDTISNFTEKDARADFASEDPKRRWKCSTKSGWKCAYKDPFDYYGLYEDGKLIRTVFEDDWAQKDQFIKLEKNQSWEKLTYAGCPAHNFAQKTGDNKKTDPFDF